MTASRTKRRRCRSPLLPPTRRLGLTTAALGPVPDEAAIEVFDWGYCHILACALHDLTGWPFGVAEQYRHVYDATVNHGQTVTQALDAIGA